MVSGRLLASAGVVVGLVIVGGGCERPAPATSIRLDSVHDLVSLLDQAEVTDPLFAEASQRAAVDASDDRDRLAFVRNVTGTSVTYRGLRTRGPARLVFACGVGSRRDSSGDDPVRFLIEGLDESRDEPEWTRLFDETLSPSTFPDDTLARAFETVLPERLSASWSLRFSTERVDGDAAVLAWPAWLSPQLLSDGREVERDEHPVQIREVVMSLVERLDEAGITKQRDDAPVVLAPIDAGRGHNEAGGEKLSLRMTAPARVRYRVDVPPDARLELLYGVDADTGWSLPGDGVTFAIDVAGEHVWKQRVDAHRLRRFRGWKSDVVDLRPWVGRKVPIDLLTMPGPDDRNDVGAFATARIVKSRNVERLLAHEAPTVIVILVDTLRADRLTAYGHDGGLTPNLDRLAADGVVFRNARSAASWTLPATTSILTGLSPADHGVIDARRSDLDDGIDTLAERFQLRGYTTGAFVTNPLIGPTSNLVQGFETFVAAPFLGARALNERVVAWLDGNVGVAHFVYVHAIDPHSPYEPEWREDVTDAPKGSEPEVLWYEMLQRGPFDEAAVATWREAVIPRYDADVRSFDTALGEFLEALEQRGVLEDAVIALVSDHGEEFFEHGQQGHGGQLYDETLAVPLIVTGFGRSELEPAVVDDPVRARRLLSTLCELAGVPLPDDPRVAGTLFASRNAGPAFSVTTHGYEPGIDGWTTKLCVVHRRSKLIHTPASGRTELYDLVDDPAEEHDLSAERPEEAAFLREQVLAWWATAGAADAEQGGEDAQTQAALRALGYVERTEKH